MIHLEQHDYDKGEFKDDCFKIKAIPLRATNYISNHGKNNSFRGDLIDCICCFTDAKRQRATPSNDLSRMTKFPDDLIYAYLCEVSMDRYLRFH